VKDNNGMANEEQIEFKPRFTPYPGTESKPLRFLANVVSVICHPVFFPIVMAYVLYLLEPAAFMGASTKQLGLWFISIAVTAVFFPLFSIALMKPLGFIASFHMKTARERTIPLMSTMIFYFWVTHVFNNIPNNPPLALKVLLLGNFWGIIAIFMINIFTKISMHTATAGAMIGIIIVLAMSSTANMTVPLLVSIVIAGIIGTARMLLGAHERGDIWLGYIIGVLVQLGAYLYMK
jgi:PAP2 superfamily